MKSPSSTTPTATDAAEYGDQNCTSTATPDSSSSVTGDDPSQALPRPKMGTRKSSGTTIVPREHPRVELKEGDEVFDADDARAMSPRRSSQDLEKMGQEARARLNEHVKALHESLLEIFTHIEAVKNEHDKLDNNNKFLQKYIRDLKSTPSQKIYTSTYRRRHGRSVDPYRELTASCTSAKSTILRADDGHDTNSEDDEDPRPAKRRKG